MKSRLFLVLCALLGLSACDAPKPRHFFCITVLGIGQFDVPSPNTAILNDQLRIDQGAQYVYIPKAMCIEVEER